VYKSSDAALFDHGVKLGIIMGLYFRHLQYCKNVSIDFYFTKRFCFLPLEHCNTGLPS